MPETEKEIKKEKKEKKKRKKGFFANMAVELRKVIWPSPAQTAKSTSVTIGFVLLIAGILIFLDSIFDLVNSAWWSLWQ